MSLNSINFLSELEIINEGVKSFVGEKYYMATGDLSNDETNDLEFVSYNKKPSRAALTAKPGDVIFARMKGTNKVLLITEKESDYIFSTGFVVLRPSENVNKSYLTHYLKSSLFQAEKDKLCTGATQKAINNQNIEKLKFPLTQLVTQKRISKILDTVNELRHIDQAMLKKYNDLAQAIFIDMFGDIMENKNNYPITKFGDVCNELFLGLTSKVDYVVKGGYPLIRTTDINQGELSFKKVKFISEAQHKKLTSRRITKKGDVLISKSGTLGTCAIVDSDEEFSTYESIFTVRANPQKLNNIFLVALIRNPSFQDKLIGGKVGAGVAHLNLNMLRELIFPLPPIELQNKFSNSYTSINSQIKIKEKSFTKSLDLFNALIQKAFKGELVYE